MFADGIPPGEALGLIIFAVLIAYMCYWLVRNIRLPNSFAPRINPIGVPKQLQSFLPLAAKFGIGDDGDRYEVASADPDEEKRQLREVYYSRSEEIDQWIDSFGVEPMSDEAASFMYMLLAADELNVFGDPIFSDQASRSDPEN